MNNAEGTFPTHAISLKLFTEPYYIVKVWNVNAANCLYSIKEEMKLGNTNRKKGQIILTVTLGGLISTQKKVISHGLI